MPLNETCLFLFQALRTVLYLSLWSRIGRGMVLLQQRELRQPLRDHEEADELFQVAPNENRSAVLASSTGFTECTREVVRGGEGRGGHLDPPLMSP